MLRKMQTRQRTSAQPVEEVDRNVAAGRVNPANAKNELYEDKRTDKCRSLYFSADSLISSEMRFKSSGERLSGIRATDQGEARR